MTDTAGVGQSRIPQSSPNARTMEETEAMGGETFGALNQHPSSKLSEKESSTEEGKGNGERELSFKVGVSVDKNKKCRRTMEDAHSFIYDFGGIKGQGYFAVFDGHAGKHAAEWCGENFHEYLLTNLRHTSPSPSPTLPSIPSLLNQTFQQVDSTLTQLSLQSKTHSGCTAVVAFLRLEDHEGNTVGEGGGVGSGWGVERAEGDVEKEKEKEKEIAKTNTSTGGGREDVGGASLMRVKSRKVLDEERELEEQKEKENAKNEGEKEGEKGLGLKEKIKDLILGDRNDDEAEELGSSTTPSTTGTTNSTTTPESSNTTESLSTSTPPSSSSTTAKSTDSESTSTKSLGIPIEELKSQPASLKLAAKRTLYTANVGDARAVLGRNGKAIRLTYDHKGSDTQEAKRITDAGGYVMNNRVNGVLAVTRSLGDSSMKEFVVGSPYTTETTLGEFDKWLIVACDGLWDVCTDQQAIDLIQNLSEAQEASKVLLEFALKNFSSDNLSVLVVNLRPGSTSSSTSASRVASTN